MLAAKRGCVAQLFGEDVDRELVGMRRGDGMLLIRATTL